MSAGVAVVLHLPYFRAKGRSRTLTRAGCVPFLREQFSGLCRVENAGI